MGLFGKGKATEPPDLVEKYKNQYETYVQQMASSALIEQAKLQHAKAMANAMLQNSYTIGGGGGGCAGVSGSVGGYGGHGGAGGVYINWDHRTTKYPAAWLSLYDSQLEAAKYARCVEET